MFNKNIFIGIVIGICVAVTAFHVWFAYSLLSRTAVNEANIKSIVEFINKNTTSAPAPAATAPSETTNEK
jgi:uncharacterized membrane protein YukC